MFSNTCISKLTENDNIEHCVSETAPLYKNFSNHTIPKTALNHAFSLENLHYYWMLGSSDGRKCTNLGLQFNAVIVVMLQLIRVDQILNFTCKLLCNMVLELLLPYVLKAFQQSWQYMLLIKTMCY